MALLFACGPMKGGGSGSGSPPATLLTVQFTGDGKGRVTSNPAGIDCPTACSMTLMSGASVSLSAVPDASSTFAGWGGGCSGAAGCIVSGDKIVWANFAANVPPPPPPQCAGIAAPDAVPMQQFVHQKEAASFTCQAGSGDAAGTLAFPKVFNDPNNHGWSVDFVVSTGAYMRTGGGSWNSVWLIQQPSGFAGIGGPDYLGPYRNGLHIARWDSGGNKLSDTLWSAKNYAGAGNPSGGVFLAGDLSTDPSGPSFQHAAAMFASNGIVAWGPKALASAGTVFGAGVDLLGRALVITGGSASGNISAQWFDSNGISLTGEFTLLTGFAPGQSTWFETSALIGGGLMVRRMDYDGTYQARALVVVASGSASVQTAPGWMMARPDAQLQIARGGRGYAVLPYGAKNVACTQRIEVLAADGISCGSHEFPIAAGNCDTLGLTLGADGTVIQQLPSSMETKDPVNSFHTCTWRWWTAAVR
jgi:hypothetical protein